MRTAKTDQTGRMPRLIPVFAGRTGHFVVQRLLCGLVCLFAARLCLLKGLFINRAQPRAHRQGEVKRNSGRSFDHNFRFSYIF